MKAPILVIAVGLVSGTVGAVVAGRFGVDRPQSRGLPQADPRPAAPAVVPPGWDPRFLGRLNDVEEQVQALKAKAAQTDAEVSSPSGAVEVNRREAERLEHYRAELQSRAAMMAEHDHEPIDNSWASAETDELTRALTARKLGGEVKLADCRSKTCAVTLSFPTPSSAIVSLNRNASDLGVAGCLGYVAIPTPPESAGSYDLTIIYNCR
jgi:hypothetical protein